MEWLRSILAECFPGAKLAGFDRIGLEHGLASTALRLRLDGPGAPRSVVVKYWSIDGPAGFEELPFYATFGRDLGIRIPLCYYGVVDAANKRVVLVLEDLEGAVQGNVLGQVDASGAAALARTIATLHAKWWESAELDSQTWLQAIEPRKPEWLRSRREMFMSRFGDQTDPLLRELLEPGRSGGGDGRASARPAHPGRCCTATCTSTTWCSIVGRSTRSSSTGRAPRRVRRCSICPGHGPLSAPSSGARIAARVRKSLSPVADARCSSMRAECAEDGKASGASWPLRLCRCLVVATLVAGTLPARARAEFPGGFLVGGGLGISGAGAGPETDAGAGISGRTAVSVWAGRMLFTARFTANDGGDSHYPAWLGGTIHDFFYDAGLLAGFTAPVSGRWRWLMSAGLAGVWGKRVGPLVPGLFGPYPSRIDVGLRLGVPLEVGVVGRVWGIFGVGLVAHANINSEETFAGATLNVLAGRP